MKKVLFAMVLALLNLPLYANILAKDTTIVEFNDQDLKNKVKVITGNNKTFDIPKNLNLNNILKAIGVDSSEREKAIILISSGENKKDTLLVLSKEGQKIKIIARDSFFKKDSTVTPAQPPVGEEEEPDEPQKVVKKPNSMFKRSDFAIYLGLNNFTNKNPMGPNSLYDLRPWPSRFFALSFRKNVTLVKGKAVDLAFSYGPEFAWNNFMLENSNRAVYSDQGQVSFVQAASKVNKSKLVLPTFNLPILFNIGFKESKFKFGVGGYIGYKIGGYTKVKYENSGKFKTKASYGMQDFIYGLTTEFGRKNGLTLFFRYNLNETFRTNQVNAQGLHAFSAGIRI